MARRKPKPPPVTPPPPPPTGEPPPAVLIFTGFAWLGGDAVASMMDRPDDWPVAFAHLGALYLRLVDLRSGAFKVRKGADDGTAMLDRLLMRCADAGVRVGVNVPMMYQCDGREKTLDDIHAEAVRFARMGFRWDDLQGQSGVSGARQTIGCKSVYPKGGGGVDPEAIHRRAADLVAVTRLVRGVFPAVRPVLADTAAAKDDEEHSAAWDIERDYGVVVGAMRGAGLFDRGMAAHLAFDVTEAGARLEKVRRGLAVCRALGLVTGVKPIVPVGTDGAAGYVSRYDRFVRALWDGGEGTWPAELQVTAWNRAESGVVMDPETNPAAVTYAVAGWCRDGMIAKRT